MSCDFQIFFENDSCAFYSGQVMCGIVRLKLYKKKSVRKFYIETNEYTHQRWAHHDAGECYLNERLYLIDERGKQSLGE